MGSIEKLFIFSLMLHILCFIAQTAMTDINPQSTALYFQNSSGFSKYYISEYGNPIAIDSNQLSTELNPTAAENPETSDSIIPFIDSISTAKNWIFDRIAVLAAVAFAPYNLLASVPAIPTSLSVVIGGAWFLFTVIVFFGFIVGRVT